MMNVFAIPQPYNQNIPIQVKLWGINIFQSLTSPKGHHLVRTRGRDSLRSAVLKMLFDTFFLGET